MKVISTNPTQFTVKRKGGCIIVNRLDFWIATQDDWQLAASLNFQDVQSHQEDQSIILPKGNYTVVTKNFIEESINGVFSFEIAIGSQIVGSKSGDVNTTSSPHDSMTYKNQFILEVQ
jgi:hypothetical protein